MAEANPERRSHHVRLEQTRDQVIELLSRQAVERNLLERSPQPSHDVVSHLMDRQQQAALEQKLASLHPADVAFVLEAFAPDVRERAWQRVRPARRAAVLLETSPALRRALVQPLAPEAIAELVQPLDPEDVAELLGDLPEQTRQRALARLESRERAEIRSLLSFPPGSVGAEMDLEIVTVPEDAPLERVQDSLRRRAELPAQTDELIVVSSAGRLRGLLPLSRVLLGAPDARVAAEMRGDPIYFSTDDTMEDAASAFQKYDLLSAPVVNLHDQVVGRLTVDAVLDHVRERVQSEGLRQVGLSTLDEDRFAPLAGAARGRWPWLAINLCTAFAASRVIGIFEPVIGQRVALAALMPIVASVGGNTGNQSVALVIRRLSQGPLGLGQFLGREVAIAGVNGALWGGVLGALAWAIYGDAALAGVLALALWLNLMLAAAIGVLSPALLQRAGRDPALGSSIVLTAATDCLGFALFLGLAALLLV